MSAKPALRGSTISAALHRLGFNPKSKRAAGRAEGIKVSGSGKGPGTHIVSVLCDFDDLAFGWEMAELCAEALTGAGWAVEMRQPPRLPGLTVTGRQGKP